MKSINEVELLGNIGKEPEVRYTPDGACVISLTLATDESYRDKNSGQTVPQTEWHRVVAWNRLAEILRDYSGKGSRILVKGKLKTRSWDENGQKRYVTEVVARNVILLDSKQSDGSGMAVGRSQQPQEARNQKSNTRGAPPQQNNQRTQNNPNQQNGYQPQNQNPQRQQSPQPQQEEDFVDDEIPF